MNSAKIRWTVVVMLVSVSLGAGSAAWHFWREKARLMADLNQMASQSDDQSATASGQADGVASPQGDSTTKALQSKLGKLARENAQLRRELARSAPPAKPAAESDGPATPPDWRNFRQSMMQARQDYLDKLKTTDPEQYEKEMKAEEARKQWWKEHMQRAETRLADQKQFIGSIDTSTMSDEQRENHEKLVDLTAKMDELGAKIAASTDPDEQHQLGHQRGELLHSARALLESERAAVLADLGRRIGYNDAEAQQFTDYVKNVYDMTSMDHMFRGGPGGGGDRGGGGRQR